MISVVIPARDAAATLGRTLASVAGQSHSPHEILVIDDGSRDATADIARAAGARVLHAGGIGVAAARNVGLRAATGDVVAFLDADDAWSPDYLQGVEVAAGAADIVASGVVEVGPDGRFISHRPAPDPRGLRPADVLLGVPLLTSAVAVRRDVVVELGGFDPSFAASEDSELWLRLLLSGARLGAAGGTTYYTVRDGPEPRAKLDRVVRDQRRFHDRAYALLDLPPRERAAAERALHTTWARRYEASGYGRDARRYARALTPGVRGVALVAYVSLPAAARRGVKRVVRASRRARARRAADGSERLTEPPRSG